MVSCSPRGTWASPADRIKPRKDTDDQSRGLCLREKLSMVCTQSVVIAKDQSNHRQIACCSLTLSRGGLFRNIALIGALFLNHLLRKWRLPPWKVEVELCFKEVWASQNGASVMLGLNQFIATACHKIKVYAVAWLEFWIGCNKIRVNLLTVLNSAKLRWVFCPRRSLNFKSNPPAATTQSLQATVKEMLTIPKWIT